MIPSPRHSLTRPSVTRRRRSDGSAASRTPPPRVFHRRSASVSDIDTAIVAIASDIYQQQDESEKTIIFNYESKNRGSILESDQSDASDFDPFDFDIVEYDDHLKKHKDFNLENKTIISDQEESELSKINDELWEEVCRREIEQYDTAASFGRKRTSRRIFIILFLVATVAAVSYLTSNLTWTPTTSSQSYFSDGNNENSFSYDSHIISLSLKNACAAAKCCSPCFKDNNNDKDNCLENKNKFCINHLEECQHACLAWRDSNDNDIDDVSTTVASFKAHLSTIERIPLVCNEQRINEEPKISIECQILCASQMCCFSNNTDENCYHKKDIECPLYESCRILNSDSSDFDPEVCSLTNIASNEGYGTCQRYCSRRACCFLPRVLRGGCYMDNPKWCEEYKVCMNLFSVEPK